MHSRWILAAGLALLLLLQGCAPVAVVGVAAGASAAHDRRSLGAIIDDQNIELKAKSKINNDSTIKDLVHINVVSMNGIVLLTGEAATQEARDQVLTQVRSVNGVRRITNEMRITEPSNFGSRSLDALITSAIKSRMLVSPDFDPTRIKVVTENSVVYLMGLVTHAEGDQAVTLTTSIDGVTGVVKVFEYID
jgi:osmotically-inducible protein OsmY